MRKPLLAVAGLVLAAIALSACAGGSTSGDSSSAGDDSILTIANGRGITTFEGDSCFNASAMTVIYDGLLRISDDGSSVEPGLASAYEYDDATDTYTFHLREDAGFSNGQLLTADDVVFSFGVWEAGEYSGSFYSNIASVTATDEHTVSVQMTGPDSFLPMVLTWCSSTVYPNNYAGMTEDDYFAKPISAGGYAVDSTSDFGGPSEVVHLVKNQYAWDADDLLLDGIDFELISDVNQRTLQFESGEVDIIQSVDPSAQAELSEDQLLYVPSAGQQQLVVNANDSSLADSSVRQAISLAINRDDLVAAVDGKATAATGVLPSTLPNVVEPADPYEYDPEQAKELLDGKTLTLDLAYPSASESAATISQVIASQLADVGITVVLQPADEATVTANISSGDFQLSYQVLSAISPSPFDPAALLPYSRYPAAGGDTTVSEAALIAGMAAMTDEEAQAAVQEIQDDGVSQNIVIGLVELDNAFAVSTSVSGFNPTGYSNIFYPEGISKD